MPCCIYLTSSYLQHETKLETTNKILSYNQRACKWQRGHFLCSINLFPIGDCHYPKTNKKLSQTSYWTRLAFRIISALKHIVE